VEEFGIENPPNAAGGCLLTDPAFALSAKDLFKHVETPTTNEIDLLKIGRHFRFDEKTKLIVGRNENENEKIKALELPDDVLLEAKDFVGPTSLLRGTAENHMEISASITLRYSDSKNKRGIIITHKNGIKSEIPVMPSQESSYLRFRI